jgi:hypothetical protein
LIILAPGGLGNQLFSIASALHLAEVKNIKIKVFSDNVELVARFIEIRKRENLPIKVKVIFSRQRNLWLNKTSSRLHILFSKTPLMYELVRKKFLTTQIPWEFPFYLVNSSTKPPWVLRGFLQDSQLLENLSEQSRSILAKILGVESLGDYVSEIENSRLMGVHIRRGDYNSIPDYGTLSASYFQSTINELKTKGLRTLIASDDSDILKSFEGLEGYAILDPHSYTPLETMITLAKTKYFIMSNSTFSFWIAWVISQGGGTVYAPEPWFKKSKVPRNYLYLDSFIKKPSVFEDANAS